MYISSVGSYSFLAIDIKADPTNITGCSTDWTIFDVYNGACDGIHCCICLRSKYSLSGTINSRYAEMG